MIMPFQGRMPRIHPSAFIAPGAQVIGNVKIGKDSSVWFGAVLRGDMHAITIGAGTNIQDGAVVHVDHDRSCVVKDGVIVGHQATVHACTIEKGALIGIGARILSGAKVGEFSLIGAGAVVLEKAVIPAYSLVVGVPGKVVRTLTAKEAATHVPWAKRYAALAKEYKKYLG
jgi:carbonic anhydrase/acetyltransferase-like protein (isoleucine patch superfamily)